MDAATNATLHLSLVERQQEQEQLQRAILLLLQIFTEAFVAQPNRHEELIIVIAENWNGWLEENAPRRWRSGNPRVDEIDRFIDAACFLPTLAGVMATEAISDCTYVEDVVGLVIRSHLDIAFSLFESLPVYLTAMILPKLSLALGAAAAYAGKKELACRSYWEGLRSCDTGTTQAN